MGWIPPTPKGSVRTPRGKVGEMVLAQQPNEKIVVRRPPERREPFTENEQRSQRRFALAVDFVKSLPSRPELRAIYQRAALEQRRRACDLALGDFISPPSILGIDVKGYAGKAGQEIRFQAVDDFQVAQASLKILDLSRTMLEEGPAQLESGSTWVYQAQVDLAQGQCAIVEVTVSDWAGNVVQKEALAVTGVELKF